MKHHTTLLFAAAVALLPSCATQETDHDLFVKSDTNKDGKLSLDEVNKMGLPRLFDLFDVNGDRSVTLAEAREIQPGFDAAEFASRDLNKDGKVTYEEYLKVAESRGGLKKTFALVDANKDGLIDKAEADAYVEWVEKQPPVTASRESF